MKPTTENTVEEIIANIHSPSWTLTTEELFILYPELKKAKQELDTHYLNIALEIIGEDKPEDKTFTTSSGGISNMGENHLLNERNRELREQFKKRLKDKYEER